ncbi:coiled-coil domain-containing protein 43-like isoform X1 [Argonauta hians]
MADVGVMCGDPAAFSQWLEGRLLQLNDDLDGAVFVTYITGILESYTAYDERKESLLDIVGEIAESSKDEVCDEIIQRWDTMCSSEAELKEADVTPMDEKLSKMLSTSHAVVSSSEKKGRQLSEDELAQKQAILQQYSNVCDDPDQLLEMSQSEAAPSVGGGGGGGGLTLSSIPLLGHTAAAAASSNTASSLSLLMNTNRDSIQRQEKEMRERMKLENEKKKEKDKQDRDSQKNKRQERKENEKKRTQKGERRR